MTIFSPNHRLQAACNHRPLLFSSVIFPALPPPPATSLPPPPSPLLFSSLVHLPSPPTPSSDQPPAAPKSPSLLLSCASSQPSRPLQRPVSRRPGVPFFSPLPYVFPALPPPPATSLPPPSSPLLFSSPVRLPSPRIRPSPPSPAITFVDLRLSSPVLPTCSAFFSPRTCIPAQTLRRPLRSAPICFPTQTARPCCPDQILFDTLLPCPNLLSSLPCPDLLWSVLEI